MIASIFFIGIARAPRAASLLDHCNMQRYGHQPAGWQCVADRENSAHARALSATPPPARLRMLPRFRAGLCRTRAAGAEPGDLSRIEDRRSTSTPGPEKAGPMVLKRALEGLAGGAGAAEAVDATLARFAGGR
jgi:hypothetical protein